MNLANLNPFKHKSTDVPIPRGLAIVLAFVIAGGFAIELGWGIYTLFQLMGSHSGGGEGRYYVMASLYTLVPPIAYFIIAYAFHPKTVQERRRVFISLLIAFAGTAIASGLSVVITQIGFALIHDQQSPPDEAISNIYTILVTFVPVVLYAALLMYLRQSKRWK